MQKRLSIAVVLFALICTSSGIAQIPEPNEGNCYASGELTVTSTPHQGSCPLDCNPECTGTGSVSVTQHVFICGPGEIPCNNDCRTPTFQDYEITCCEWCACCSGHDFTGPAYKCYTCPDL